MKVNTKKILLLLAISFILGIIISFKDISWSIYLYKIYGAEKTAPVVSYAIISGIYSVFLIFCLLWVNIVRKRSESKLKLFLVSLAVTVILCCFASLLIGPEFPDELFKIAGPEHHHGGHDEHLIFLGIKSFIILCIIFVTGIIYNLYLKKNEAEKSLEKLKSESLQSKLTALSNQINPHFFFNALNSLHSLISEDKKESSLAYLSNLSNVFRYILQSESKNLVSLQEELDFLNEYKFMLSIKYGDKLSFEYSIDKEYLFYQLPVLSVLPVVENVIKHNEISSRNPIVIKMFARNDELIIVNKIKPKIDPVISNGTGLKNLNNRYLLLTNREIKIDRKTEEFSVSLPLARLQK